MNIYVSNLSFQTSEEELTGLFSEFGTVTSAKIITDRLTQRSRGFAFVEMASGEEGNTAIDRLNGRDINGRTISVSVAREKEDLGTRGGFRDNGYRRSY
jgi:RNA recognition motif-containing protein